MTYTHLLLAAGDTHGTGLEIRGAKYHHLVRVRRIAVGASLRGVLPDGRIILAEVSEITPEVLRARITGEEPAQGEPPCRITLYQAVLKGEKMEWVVQKASELGVTTLVPLLTRRTIPQWTPAQAVERAERWQRIADSAAEQCERHVPLLVVPPGKLSEYISTDDAMRLLLHERNGQPLPRLAAEYPVLKSIGIYIGPEGGWDDREVSSLCEAGVAPVHLGGRILRAETASLVAATLVQYIWGDLAGNVSVEG